MGSGEEHGQGKRDAQRERDSQVREAEAAVAEVGAAGEKAATALGHSGCASHQTVQSHYCSLRLSLFFQGLRGGFSCV